MVAAGGQELLMLTSDDRRTCLDHAALPCTLAMYSLKMLERLAPWRCARHSLLQGNACWATDRGGQNTNCNRQLTIQSCYVTLQLPLEMF